MFLLRLIAVKTGFTLVNKLKYQIIVMTTNIAISK